MTDYRKRIRIGVIGGAQPEPKFRKIAFEVGKLIAEKGAILVCGGLSGVMEETARGVKKAGGLSIGILPGGFPKDANRYIDIPLATGMGFSRNHLVVMNADVLIAIDGEYGTLSEIAYGCVHKKKIIGIGTWNIEGVVVVETAEQAVDLALQDFFPLIR
ncbi:MAG: TIGR00725 family protein [Candidatus Aminicenantes bacterium]|nr:TIGR00725 family protein [Candidatus Aminicenantes bacterium]